MECLTVRLLTIESNSVPQGSADVIRSFLNMGNEE